MREPLISPITMSQKTKRHPQFVPLTLLLVIMAVLGGGCVGVASSTLPPPLSATQKVRLKTARLPLTVGVERYKYPAYSDALVKALRNTGVFVRVDHLERFSSPPSLVARVERQISGSTVIPILTLLTFGIIPTTADETYGYAFSLGTPGREPQRVPVEYSYQGRVTLGWVSVFLWLTPGHSTFNPEHNRRFRGRLALAILDHADEFGK
ncbi:MAG: hypothetical protein JWR26_3155 [Pedosphaera sp.]|nr:hypothetical protein [Pedosphaera sp.]